MSNRPRQAPPAPAERGERALLQTTRALAGSQDLDVSFGPSLPGQTPNAVRLPVVCALNGDISAATRRK